MRGKMERVNGRARPLCAALVGTALLVGWLVFFTTPAAGQIAAASINGIVRDPSGAVIPAAAVTLTNTQTNVRYPTKTNETGNYVILNIPPGQYVLEVSKEGFATAKQTEFSLAVNQTATFDFTLQVGAAVQTIEVSAVAAHVETSTAELGSVIGHSEVTELPLDGRNFTQLLTLTPGVSPISPGRVGTGWPSQPVGAAVFPAVQGQGPISNMFLLDGVNNFGSLGSSYAVAPIMDTVQEFKVQTHNDEAQFGQVLGGIVNVVTKSGTNAFHGTAWEFLRNDALDARNFFSPDVTPLKQNMFGANVGGPLILPGYSGRDKTFFFVAYEGFRRRTGSLILYRVPTAAELRGDLSGVAEQIYDPFSTREDPDDPGEYIRDPFPDNQIPSNLIDPKMVLFAETLFPRPVETGFEGFNGRDTSPIVVNQNQFFFRLDQNFREKDRLFIRFTPTAQAFSGSAGYEGYRAQITMHASNLAASWIHTFGPSAVAEFTFGHIHGRTQLSAGWPSAPANFLDQMGFAPNFINHPEPMIPGMVPSGYLATANQAEGAEMLGNLRWSHIWEYKGQFSKVSGRHTFKMGSHFATNTWLQPWLMSTAFFDSYQTANLLTGEGGDGLASFLLGVPGYGEFNNVYSEMRGGGILSHYFQDQWKVTDKLTLNLGLRYDVTFTPRQGVGEGDYLSAGSNITGTFDFTNGTYILQNPAPACSPTQGAPCIPGGVLPPNVLVAEDGKLSEDDYGGIQPRIGLAYRLTPKTALRGAYARFTDNWAGITASLSANTQSWPNLGYVAADINEVFVESRAQDPLNLGSGPIYPDPTPFTQTNAFFDPLRKTPKSEQWNFGLQRQLGANMILTVNYVGSHSYKLPLSISGNAALTPGPGDPRERAPFPDLPYEPYSVSWGKSRYNALQASFARRAAGGLQYLISYTWSETFAIGSNIGGIQDPYHWQNDKGPALFDLPQMLVASWMYPIPLGKRGKSTGNRVLDHVLGNWQFNGIGSVSSGQPFSVTAPVAIQNTQNWSGRQLADLVGDPYAGATKLVPINREAFARPATYTFGNLPPNSLRSDWRRNLDLSIFREFPITESKKLQFRFEGFNITNTPVFATPATSITSRVFGRVSKTANRERILQFSLKFYF